MAILLALVLAAGAFLFTARSSVDTDISDPRPAYPSMTVTPSATPPGATTTPSAPATFTIPSPVATRSR
jgi:hypothetical protein